jgi:hypothetical protein
LGQKEVSEQSLELGLLTAATVRVSVGAVGKANAEVVVVVVVAVIVLTWL